MACVQKADVFTRGKESASVDSASGEINRENENLWRALNEVQDPEFPMSIVEMGLIYGVEKHANIAKVEMTFTSMGCPCMEMMLFDVKKRLKKEPGVDDVELEIVWDPPWTSERLSPSGAAKLAVWGVAA